jgi:hypothetical protein
MEDANCILDVENPKLVLVMGCVGFGLNLISVLFLHGMNYAVSPQIVLIYANMLVDHGHDHGGGHSHGHNHGHEHSHSHDHGTDSGEGSAPEASTDTDPDAVRLMDGKVSTALSEPSLTPEANSTSTSITNTSSTLRTSPTNRTGTSP